MTFLDTFDSINQLKEFVFNLLLFNAWLTCSYFFLSFTELGEVITSQRGSKWLFYTRAYLDSKQRSVCCKIRRMEVSLYEKVKPYQELTCSVFCMYTNFPFSLSLFLSRFQLVIQSSFGIWRALLPGTSTNIKIHICFEFLI